MGEDKRAFEVGQWVEFTAVVEQAWQSEDDDGPAKKIVTRTELERPLEGKVVGFTYRKEGRIQENYYAPNGFVSENSVGVWKVLRGVLNKPVDVHPDDMRPIERDGRLPMKVQDWSDLHIDIFRENANRAKRDDEGRFVSVTGEADK